MPKALSILFGALLTIACSWALGRIVVQRLRASLYRVELELFSFLAGAAVFSLLLLALSAAHLIYDATLLVAAALIFGAAWRLKALQRASFTSPPEPLAPLPRLWRYLFPSVYLAFAAVCFIHAMAPESSPDGSSYHLGVIARYYREHAMVRIDTNMYASMPQGLEMLFLNAWAFGRHSAAALVHLAFLLALPLLMLRYGQRIGQAHTAAAAGLFALCSPVAMIDGASAYNDLAVAALLFAIFYLVEIDAPPALAGLLAGFAFAVKYTAFLGLAYLLIRYALRRDRRALLTASLAAAVSILPWLARNFILYDNPVSPFFNRFFPNRWVHISFEQDYVEMMRHYNGLDSYSLIPRDITIKGVILGGFFGPLFYLAPLALLSLRKRLGRAACAAALLFALPYASNVGTRFLLPSLPFVSLALAAAIPAPVLPFVAAAHAVLSFPDVPARYCGQYAWRIAGIPFSAALRLEDETTYLGRVFTPYGIAKMIDRSSPPGARVFAFTSVPESYTTREILVSFQSARNERLTDLFYAASLPDFRPNLSHTFRFTARPLSAIRIVQTAPAGPRDQWSISELRLFNGPRELTRDPDWRLTARPSPWEIQSAFDASPLTRWRSWERIRPAMFVEAAFDRPRSIDAIVLEMSTDQYAVRMAASGRTPDGLWHPLAAEPVTTPLAPPLGLRRAAAAELKRGGVTHVLLVQGDFLWDEITSRPALWGLSLTGEVDGARLFRLE